MSCLQRATVLVQLWAVCSVLQFLFSYELFAACYSSCSAMSCLQRATVLVQLWAVCSVLHFLFSYELFVACYSSCSAMSCLQRGTVLVQLWTVCSVLQFLFSYELFVACYSSCSAMSCLQRATVLVQLWTVRSVLRDILPNIFTSNRNVFTTCCSCTTFSILKKYLPIFLKKFSVQSTVVPRYNAPRYIVDIAITWFFLPKLLSKGKFLTKLVDISL